MVAASCISLTLPWVGSCLREEPILRLGWMVRGQGGMREDTKTHSSPHCPCCASGCGSPLLPPAGRPLASQHLSLPGTLLTPPQDRRVFGRLSSPEPPSPGQQVYVLCNSSLPSEAWEIERGQTTLSSEYHMANKQVFRETMASSGFCTPGCQFRDCPGPLLFITAAAVETSTICWVPSGASTARGSFHAFLIPSSPQPCGKSDWEEQRPWGWSPGSATGWLFDREWVN